MPSQKLKASEVAKEARRLYIPYIKEKYPSWLSGSIIHQKMESLQAAPDRQHKLRVAVIQGNHVDVALDWYDHSPEIVERKIPIINWARAERPGGCWEVGSGQEEDLWRRSSLSHALTEPAASNCYPISESSGIYSPSVGMLLAFRILDAIFPDGNHSSVSVWCW